MNTRLLLERPFPASRPSPRHGGMFMAGLRAGAREAARRLLGQPASDWDLWRQATGGQAQAASDLVRRLTPAAMALARQMLGRTEDAEDAVQESFLRLWSAQVDDSRGAQLSTLFHTIVLNRCRSQLVRRREFSTEPELLNELQDAQQDAVMSADIGGTDAEALRAALQRLPARQRMALALWAYADADTEAIARALDIDANAANQLLFRARRNLRALWQEQTA